MILDKVRSLVDLLDTHSFLWKHLRVFSGGFQERAEYVFETSKRQGLRDVVLGPTTPGTDFDAIGVITGYVEDKSVRNPAPNLMQQPPAVAIFQVLVVDYDQTDIGAGQCIVLWVRSADVRDGPGRFNNSAHKLREYSIFRKQQ